MSTTIPWRSWLLLGALSLLLFLITASTFSSLGVVLPAMIKEQGWAFGPAFLGFTFLGAFCGGSSKLPAILIRKIGVRGTIVAGSAVMVAGFTCLAASPGLTVYLVGTALLGVGYQMMALDPRHPRAVDAVQEARPAVRDLFHRSARWAGSVGPWMAVSGMAMVGGGWRPYWWPRPSPRWWSASCARPWSAARPGLKPPPSKPTRPWPTRSRPRRPTPRSIAPPPTGRSRKPWPPRSSG